MTWRSRAATCGAGGGPGGEGSGAACCDGGRRSLLPAGGRIRGRAGASYMIDEGPGFEPWTGRNEPHAHCIKRCTSYCFAALPLRNILLRTHLPAHALYKYVRVRHAFSRAASRSTRAARLHNAQLRAASSALATLYAAATRLPAARASCVPSRALTAASVYLWTACYAFINSAAGCSSRFLRRALAAALVSMDRLSQPAMLLLLSCARHRVASSPPVFEPSCLTALRHLRFLAFSARRCSFSHHGMQRRRDAAAGSSAAYKRGTGSGISAAAPPCSATWSGGVQPARAGERRGRDGCICWAARGVGDNRWAAV